jgi:hypothetical protein
MGRDNEYIGIVGSMHNPQDATAKLEYRPERPREPRIVRIGHHPIGCGKRSLNEAQREASPFHLAGRVPA